MQANFCGNSDVYGKFSEKTHELSKNIANVEKFG
jgi:hypothetical protein